MLNLICWCPRNYIYCLELLSHLWQQSLEYQFKMKRLNSGGFNIWTFQVVLLILALLNHRYSQNLCGTWVKKQWYLEESDAFIKRCGLFFTRMHCLCCSSHLFFCQLHSSFLRFESEKLNTGQQMCTQKKRQGWGFSGEEGLEKQEKKISKGHRQNANFQKWRRSWTEQAHVLWKGTETAWMQIKSPSFLQILS